MTEQEPMMRVNVAKQDMPVNDGESIDGVLRMLRDAAADHIRKALKVDKLKDPDHAYAYAEDVFSDAIVLSVNGYGPKWKNDIGGLYQMTWTRDVRGFSFGTPVRVMRKVSYIPLKDAPVKKAENLWANVI
jgi:hypothetical protein